MLTKYFGLVFFIITGLTAARAQQAATPVRLENPGGNTVTTSTGSGLQHYTHDVRLRHRGTLFMCDEATYQPSANRFRASGQVRLVQGDSIRISSDSAAYDGPSRTAVLYGRVTLRHQRAELTTSQLTYDLNTGLIKYVGKSRLTDGTNTLTSLRGRYDTRTGQFMAYQQVALTTPLTHMRYDSLLYIRNDLPRPAIDYAQAVFVDESELVRYHRPVNESIVRVKTPTTPTRQPAPTVTATLVASKPARPVSPEAVNPPPRRAAAIIPALVRTTTPPASEVSDLERILNRQKRVN